MESTPFPDRKHPAHGIRQDGDGPLLIYLTVCTKDRRPWLACEANQHLLEDIWRYDATAWRVGYYLLMPDHLHLFCTTGTTLRPLERWTSYWKSKFSKRHGDRSHRWQTDAWDFRIRDGASYAEKYRYVQLNPVRRGLIANADDWPFQGSVNSLPWLDG